jgi:hypothetical protein
MNTPWDTSNSDRIGRATDHPRHTSAPRHRVPVRNRFLAWPWVLSGYAGRGRTLFPSARPARLHGAGSRARWRLAPAHVACFVRTVAIIWQLYGALRLGRPGRQPRSAGLSTTSSAADRAAAQRPPACHETGGDPAYHDRLERFPAPTPVNAFGVDSAGGACGIPVPRSVGASVHPRPQCAADARSPRFRRPRRPSHPPSRKPADGRLR